MITRLGLCNFTAFNELDIDFSPKINIIIGVNGTGKTHLLKAIYVLSNIGGPIGDYAPSQSKSDLRLTDKLLKTFKPSNNKVGGLFHRAGEDDAVISASFSQDEELVAKFSSRSLKANVIGQSKQTYNQGATFIPAKEVLSFLDGISNPSADQETLASLFDSTYFDLCEKLLAESKDTVEEKTSWVREGITKLMKGEFVFGEKTVRFRPGEYKQYKNINASKTYFAPSRTDSVSVTMTAEGFRKIGAIQQLLKTQAIGTGTTGPLLWDEPESNMNPELMNQLVEIILELSRKEQQIILATHDYVLLKWFDLLMDKVGKGDHVRFHVLYRDDDSMEVKVFSTDDYSTIKPNPITNAYNDLIIAHAKSRLKGVPK